jgi:predicted amidohydrolase YtcJ
MAARLATLLVVAIVATTLIAGLIVGAQRDDTSGPVDLIVHNAKVYAADDLGSTAEAVAIRGNTILHVGGEREIMRYRRKQTTVIDARGASVIPGFDDAHVSLIAGGLARDAVQLFGASTLDEIEARLTAWMDARPDAPWVVGGGWSYDAFDDLPTRAELDAIVADRPARLLSQDGRAMWVNTKALEAAGITRHTPNPQHGTIVRDRRGQATGLLRGDAIGLIDRAVPKAAQEERARALQLAIRDAQRLGITSVQDLGAAPGDLDLYDAAREAGRLPLRVYAAVPVGHTPPEDLEPIAKRFPDDPLLKTGVVTIPEDEPLDPKEVAALDAGGWQVAVEARDEHSARLALEAFAAAARGATSAKPRRHRIEGIELVDPDDMPRFGALGIVASMQPLDTAGGLATWMRLAGPERAPFGWAARSLSAAGAHLAFGSGWPRLPLDPLGTIRAAVKRAALHAPEALTLKSAINACTAGAAWASFDEHRKGTIKPGMLADLVVFSNDIFRGPAALEAAEVAMTIFDGKVVYRRPS